MNREYIHLTFWSVRAHQRNKKLCEIFVKMIILYNSSTADRTVNQKQEHKKNKRFWISHLLKLNNMSILHLEKREKKMCYIICMMSLLLLGICQPLLLAQQLVSFSSRLRLRSPEYLSPTKPRNMQRRWEKKNTKKS